MDKLAKSVYRHIRALEQVEEPFTQLMAKQSMLLAKAKQSLVDQGFTDSDAAQMIVMRGLNITGMAMDLEVEVDDQGDLDDDHV